MNAEASKGTGAAAKRGASTNAGGYTPDWPAPPGVRSWQTTRQGGVSRGSFGSFNLALHVGDRAEDVHENRRRLAQQLGLPAMPRWLEQVHGSRILRLDRGDAHGTDSSADGAVTAAGGEVLGVMTADCLPVLFAARDGAEIGAAHAGWRGLASGVLEQAVATFDTEPADLVCWLGPAIARDAFEVGDEVRAAFVDSDAGCAGAFVRNARGRWQADLYGLARRKLDRAGVSAVYGSPACTHADALRFFSHRREAPCGRMVSLIWRE